MAKKIRKHSRSGTCKKIVYPRIECVLTENPNLNHLIILDQYRDIEEPIRKKDVIEKDNITLIDPVIECEIVMDLKGINELFFQLIKILKQSPNPGDTKHGGLKPRST